MTAATVGGAGSAVGRVVASGMDRLSRSIEDAVLTEARFRHLGIRVVFADDASWGWARALIARDMEARDTREPGAGPSVP